MDDHSHKLLLDVLMGADAIAEFTRGADHQSYHTSLLLQSAVERQFEIIGEALNRLRKHDPQVALGITDHEKIIGFRNVLAHGYDVIDNDITWDVVAHKLPRLVAETRALLAAAGHAAPPGV